MNALQKSNAELVAAVRRETKQKKKYMLFTKLIAVFAVMLLVSCLIQTVRVSIIQTKYKTLEQNYWNLNTKYETLERNYQDLNTKYETLEQNYQDLNTKYKD